MPWGMGDAKKKEAADPAVSERDVHVYNINEVANDTLESTRRMRTMCEEAKDAGMKSMSALEGQGESIDRWEEVADGINEDMALAEKALKAMDAACCGMVPRFWKVGGGFKVDDAVWAEPQPPKTNQLPELKALNPDHCFVAALGVSGEQDAREKEMEENMNEVSTIIVNLRNMANDINNTTNAQNEQLDRIQKKTDSDIMRVKLANEKAAALMK